MKNRLINKLNYLRFSSFDTSTIQGRNAERYRLALLAIVSNIACKALAMVSMITAVSFTIPYLGTERFGIWMTILSLVGVLTFLDMGLGNALTNRVATAVAGDNVEAITRTITGGVGVLLIISIVVSILLTTLSKYIPWQLIIKTQNNMYSEEIKDVVSCFCLMFGLSVFSNGVQKVYFGLQWMYKANIVQSVFYAISIVLIYIASLHNSPIYILLLITFGIANISGFLLMFFLYKSKYFSFRILFASIRTEKNNLIRTGGLFLLLQIGTMISWSSDNLIISSTLGASYVAIFAILQRLFQFISQPLAIINSPLWPTYVDSLNRKDFYFIKNTLKKSIILTFILSCSGSIILVAFSKIIITHWTKGLVEIPSILIYIYGVWAIIDACSNCFAMFMNGCNIVKPQVYAVTSLCLLAIPIKYILIKYFGLVGMLSGFYLLFTINILFWYAFIYRNNIVRILSGVEK